MKKPALSELSLKEKISQLLMIAAGRLMMTEELDENGECIRRTADQIDEIMEKYQYGSIWTGAGIVDNNIEQEGFDFKYTYSNKGTAQQGTMATYKRYLERITQKVRIPVLAATNAEAGLAGQFSDGTATVTPLNVGAADDTELTYELYKNMAMEIRSAGIHWRWCPVIDVGNSLTCGCLRGFGEDHDRVIRHTIAANKGVNAMKVAGTAKHFPGGNPYNIRDGHCVTTYMTQTEEEWEQLQGIRWRAVIESGVDSIMTTHAAWPNMDDETMNGNPIPTSFSKKIVTGLLREKLGFKGVIVTDDIKMGGMATLCSYEEGLIRLINAGHDILLGVSPYDYEIIEKAVLDGRIPMERINESAQRVLDMKEKCGLFDDEPIEVDVEEAKRLTGEVNRKIAEKSITMLRDKNNMIPLSKDKIKKVIIIALSNQMEDFLDKLQVTKDEFEARGAEVTIFSNLPLRQVHLKKMVADGVDLILYAGQIKSHEPVGLPSLYNDAQKSCWSAFSIAKEKSIGVSMGWPYLHIHSLQAANTYFNIYSTAPEVQRAFVKALYGEIPCEGTSPVDTEPKLRLIYC